MIVFDGVTVTLPPTEIEFALTTLAVGLISNRFVKPWLDLTLQVSNVSVSATLATLPMLCAFIRGEDKS